MLKFSIIIPVYNASAFIGRCIDSCIGQSHSNIEIICVDDFSADNSKEVLEAYKKKDARIKCFFHSKNESQYIARRTGFFGSTGDYILFLDSDDTLRPDACSLIAKKIAQNPADIIQFGYREIPGNKKVFSPFYASSKKRISRYLAKENRYSPEVWTKAYKHSTLVNAFNTMEVFYASGPEDVYTSIVFACHAQTFSFLKKPLVNYSINTGWSVRKEYSLQTYIAWLSSYHAVIQKTRSFIAQYIPEFTDKCFDMELYLLKDFLTNRLAPEMSQELRCQFFELLPSYFSKNAICALAGESILKSGKYDLYLDFNCSFIKRTKRLIKIFLLYLKSFFR